MAGNPFDNPTMSMMYRDALQSLYAGAVMPWERDILAIAPLLADVVDPFASQDVDPLQIMGFAYNSLVTWIDEARKANYFSKRFTDLSKLVLKGVMTMGRGLITLHNRGEDLSRAPMQIGDLISVGSYHFRKSYLGVIQTAKSHPEISERLLVNQLSWTNMLLRLYKTKEKLSENKKSEIRNKISASNEEVRMKNEELPNRKSDNSSFLPLHSSLDNFSSFDDDSSLNDNARAFSEVDALFEPAALSAPRALTAMRNSGAHGDGPHVVAKSTHGTVTCVASLPAEEANIQNEELPSNAECGIRNAEEKVSGTSSNEEVRRKNEERDRDSGARIEDQGTRLNAEPEENKKSESDFRNQVLGIRSHAEEKSREEEVPDGNSDNSSFLPLHSSLDDDSSSDDGMPPYLQILRNAFGRSEPNDEGRVTFTFDEIRYLASDPDFARINPIAAADMRKILKQIDTG